MEWNQINTPLTDDVISGLRAGDACLITGKLITARDRAHERVKQLLNENKPLPFSLTGEIIYYVGPAPARPGQVIGAAGPTTSYRMDPFSKMMFELGIKGMIGKGKRDGETKKLIKEYRGVYFSSFGGAGAYLSRKITASRIIAFEDLAAEAVYELTVSQFPVVVAIDMYGGDIYEYSHR
jgi:fumarate hydratase subunit beta